VKSLFLLLAGWAALLSGMPVAHAADSAAERAAIEEIVRDYLLREPEVIYEALQELQRRQEDAAADRQRELLASRADELFADAADPRLGNSQGDVTLVEFFDYRCGYCRSMVDGIQELLERDGKLELVMKEYPILGPESTIAAKAALAAKRQGRYEAMHWALMQASELNEAAVLDLAERLGLDRNRLARDMGSAEIQAEIDGNLGLARELGIGGTPTFIIGEQIIPGAVPIDSLAGLIEAERRKPAGDRRGG
jgi:protein-disulfide isomerase